MAAPVLRGKGESLGFLGCLGGFLPVDREEDQNQAKGFGGLAATGSGSERIRFRFFL